MGTLSLSSPSSPQCCGPGLPDTGANWANFPTSSTRTTLRVPCTCVIRLATARAGSWGARWLPSLSGTFQASHLQNNEQVNHVQGTLAQAAQAARPHTDTHAFHCSACGSGWPYSALHCSACRRRTHPLTPRWAWSRCPRTPAASACAAPQARAPTAHARQARGLSVLRAETGRPKRPRRLAGRPVVRGTHTLFSLARVSTHLMMTSHLICRLNLNPAHQTPLVNNCRTN